jgi:hypothetical protein
MGVAYRCQDESGRPVQLMTLCAKQNPLSTYKIIPGVIDQTRGLELFGWKSVDDFQPDFVWNVWHFRGRKFI